MDLEVFENFDFVFRDLVLKVGTLVLANCILLLYLSKGGFDS